MAKQKTFTPLPEGLHWIKISDITTSDFNPRKTHSSLAASELKNSIIEFGILQPITVMPGEECYIVVCGERRFRAAQSAELLEIPCIVRNLTHEQALEIAITENLQRVDVHPLNEASAFKSMLDELGYDMRTIILKFSKPESYIKKRIMLLNLITELQDDFEAGKLPLRHAEELSRLSSEIQLKLYTYKDIYDRDGTCEKLTDLRWSINCETLDLSEAKFNTSDPTLFNNLACVNCPNHSGATLSLFPELDKKDDRCYNKSCFDTKNIANLKNKYEALVEDGREVYFIQTKWGDSDYNQSFDKVLTIDKDCEVLDEKTTKKHKGPWGLYINSYNIASHTPIVLKEVELPVSFKKDKNGNEIPSVENKLSNEIARINQTIELKNKYLLELSEETKNEFLEKHLLEFITQKFELLTEPSKKRFREVLSDILFRNLFGYLTPNLNTIYPGKSSDVCLEKSLKLIKSNVLDVNTTYIAASLMLESMDCLINHKNNLQDISDLLYQLNFTEEVIHTSEDYIRLKNDLSKLEESKAKMEAKLQKQTA